MPSFEFYREQFNFELSFHHIATRFLKFINSTAATIDLFAVQYVLDMNVFDSHLASCLAIWRPCFYAS